MLKGQASAQDWKLIFPDQEYIFGDFTERLWAYLTIQNLLDKKLVQQRASYLFYFIYFLNGNNRVHLDVFLLLMNPGLYLKSLSQTLNESVTKSYIIIK